MASIEKLSIRGIRAFSPHREEVIEFYRPLTVIVGANGCGKTTVIECLKVACTGTLPPGNPRGQNFVHDPKLANETEVKGIVRLRMRTLGGKPVVVMRSFQLTQLRKKLRFAGLDGVVRLREADGSAPATTQKCSELDRSVPALLGVSKAVLENVVFVHQTESNWPLQESSVLKKKFDDIFESSRYTKALEAIKKAKTENAAKAKEHAAELAVMREKVAAVSQLKRDLDEARASVADADSRMAELSDAVAAQQDAVNEAAERLADAQTAEICVRDMRTIVDEKAGAVALRREQLCVELAESDEALRSKLANYDAELEQLEQRSAGVMGRRGELEAAVAAAREALNALAAREGKLAAQVEQQRAIETARDAFAASVPADLGTRAAAAAAELDAVKQRHSAADDQLASGAATARAALAAAEEQRQTHQRQAGEAQRQLDAVAAELRGLEREASPRELREAEQAVVAAEASLREHEAAADVGRLRGEADALSRQTAALGRDIDELARRVQQLDAHRDKQSALEHRRRDAEAAQQEAARAAAAAALAPAEAAARLAGARADAERADKAAVDAEVAAGQARADLARAQAELRDAEANAARLGAEIGDELRAGGEALLAELAAKVAKAEERAIEARSAGRFIKKYIKLARESAGHQCPCCTRPMDAAELAAMEAECQARIEEMERGGVEKRERALVAARQAHAGVAAQMDVWRRWRAAEDGLPGKREGAALLEARTRDAAAALEAAQAGAQAARRARAEAEAALRAAEAAQAAVDDAARSLRKLEVDEGLLRAEVAAAVGDGLSHAEARAAHAAKTNERERALADYQARSAELQTAQEVRAARHQTLATTRQRVDALKAAMEAAEAAQRRAKELAEAQRQAQMAAVDAEAELEPLRRAAEAAAAERERARAEHRASEAQAEQAARALRDQQAELARHDEAVAAARRDDKAGQLAALAAERGAAQQRQDEAEAALAALAPELDELKRLQSDQEGLRRDVEDNLMCRRLAAELEAKRAELAAAEAQLAGFGPVEELSRRLDKGRRKLGASREERSRIEGSMQTHQERVAQIDQRLQSPEYRDLDQQHRQRTIKLTTTEMAVADLDRYYQALDKALGQYHTLKVAEINRIIRELWQITYRGDDIDCIEIKSGPEESARSARSYSYRIVMLKGDRELEMRGRCSAGQMVLASLVIRLALAECFGLGLGLLALDEPTTNLDSENKLGLAHALSQILATRSQQANFQLVCITHDEEFVTMLGQANVGGGPLTPDYYWRISRERDAVSGQCYSTIERQDWGVA